MSSWCTLVMWQITMTGHLSEISYVSALLQHLKIWKVERCINCSVPRQATSPSNCLAGLGVLTKCILWTDLFLGPALEKSRQNRNQKNFFQSIQLGGAMFSVHRHAVMGIEHGVRSRMPWTSFSFPSSLKGEGPTVGFFSLPTAYGWSSSSFVREIISCSLILNSNLAFPSHSIVGTKPLSYLECSSLVNHRYFVCRKLMFC